MSRKLIHFDFIEINIDRIKCDMQPMPKEWDGLWEQLQKRQERANMRLVSKEKEWWKPKSIKFTRKYARKRRWQQIKQKSAQFLAKVVFRGEVSFLGATRIVIVCRSKVIKFPRFYSLEAFLQGWLCNIRERNNWNILDKYLQNKLSDGRPVKVRFAPVLASYFFGYFVIMQRAAPVTEAEIKNQLADWVMNKDWKLISNFCSDPNMGNFGKLNGEIVVIDYAQ